jgi:hypothetical protein
MENKFTLKHLFTQLKAVTILVSKSFEIGLFTTILVSSANNIGTVLSFTVLGRSLTYIRNGSGLRLILEEHQHLFFPMQKNSFDLSFI